MASELTVRFAFELGDLVRIRGNSFAVPYVVEARMAAQFDAEEF